MYLGEDEDEVAANATDAMLPTVVVNALLPLHLIPLSSPHLAIVMVVATTAARQESRGECDK